MLRKLGWRGQLDAADIVATWGGGWSWAGWWWRAWGTWRSSRRSGWLLVGRWASRWLATTTASAAPAPGSSVFAATRATAATFASAVSAAVGVGVARLRLEERGGFFQKGLYSTENS